MKNMYRLICLLLTGLSASAQSETFDLVTYVPSKNNGWKKEELNNVLNYSFINSTKRTWCLISVYRSTASKGNIDADFSSEWEMLTAKNNTNTSAPQKSSVKSMGKWKTITATGKATFEGEKIFIFHKVVSGYNNCVSIVGRTNSGVYLPEIERFNASVSVSQAAAALGESNKNNLPPSVKTSVYKFSSTNWDDGWVTTAQDSWAEVTKDNIRVLVHYPDSNADAYNSVLKNGLQNAWDILVAPRYSNIRNFLLKPVQSFESIAFAEADGMERATGKTVHIVLFKKYYSTGNGRYLEFITSDKQSFEQAFGAYHNDEFGWEKLSGLQYRNRFAVAAEDLVGKWSANDYASLSYYYVNGGGYAGATATSIANEFTFFNAGKYESDHAGASGAVGNQRFSRQVYKGNFSVNNWEMQLTNRFEGGTEKYSCYFEAVRGGRILIMTDQQKSVYALVRR